MTKARHRTTCGRCGTAFTHTYGARPEYCEDCTQELRRREAQS